MLPLIRDNFKQLPLLLARSATKKETFGNSRCAKLYSSLRKYLLANLGQIARESNKQQNILSPSSLLHKILHYPLCLRERGILLRKNKWPNQLQIKFDSPRACKYQAGCQILILCRSFPDYVGVCSDVRCLKEIIGPNCSLSQI